MAKRDPMQLPIYKKRRKNDQSKVKKKHFFLSILRLTWADTKRQKCAALDFVFVFVAEALWIELFGVREVLVVHVDSIGRYNDAVASV